MRESLPDQALKQVRRQGQILLSGATLHELQDVLTRPKFDRYVSSKTRCLFLTSLLHHSSCVAVTEIITACRDPKDNKFLELALSGNADALITSDQDLLVLHPFRSLPILTPRKFLEAFPHG